MSIINAIGPQAMDGRIIQSSDVAKNKEHQIEIQNTKETIPVNTQDVKANVEQLQRISDVIGRRLRFNVNEELDKVIVKVVDPSTDKVIKEIPSAEIQKLQLHIKEAIGLLIDEKV